MANKCDLEVYNNGHVVGIYTVDTDIMEKVVEKASSKCGYLIDWHYVGGRNVVKTCGNVNEAKEEVEKAITLYWNG